MAQNSPTLEWIVGGTGWNVDVRKPGFLAQVWSDVLEKKGDKGRAARRHVESRFSWAATRPSFTAMYGIVGEDAEAERRRNLSA